MDSHPFVLLFFYNFIYFTLSLIEINYFFSKTDTHTVKYIYLKINLQENRICTLSALMSFV